MLSRFFYWLGWPLVSLYALFMLKMDVLKHAPLPDGPKILAVNHPSCTDPFLILLLSRQKMSILITEKAFKVPVFGSYLRKADHVCVVPGKGEAVLARAEQLLKQGRTVVIFPEGQISPQDGGFHRARSGVARLALSSGVPVIPVGIHLARERLHKIVSKIEGENALGDWYLRGPYHVTVGQAMRFEGNVQDREHVVSVSETIMQSIIGLAQQSARRMEAMTI
ncbi:MAG: 1-acyl-sn-glycerol-3-phosphate acyltransferase [Anaerolineae bacterium]|nr:1-acyl-sn-glycerol-3-phosphate acyltransferase [Anaerolineae bacterium]